MSDSILNSQFQSARLAKEANNLEPITGCPANPPKTTKQPGAPSPLSNSLRVSASPREPVELSFYSARDIARGLHKASGATTCKKTIQRKAARDGWPTRTEANRTLYAPPVEILEAAGLITPLAPFTPLEKRIKFTDLPEGGSPQGPRGRALAREQAVLYYLELRADGTAVELALAQTMVHFSQLTTTNYELRTFSTGALRRWIRDYQLLGINGLVDQKTGRSGRKPTAVPEDFRRRGKALTLERGSVARAARELMSHPDLPASMREVLHEAHASKSYVTPAIRAAIKPAPLTQALAQGPRTARLAGRFTPCDYTNERSGDYFVADDMTSNVYAWTEWPNPRGWLLGQPQILPVQDVRSLRWLDVRVIMRDSGLYTADDVFGLFGDVFDDFGLPGVGFVLEFGSWQSNKVIGHKVDSKTGVSHEDRIGGLSSLGLKVIPSYDPRTKVIESSFNQIQHMMDGVPGFAGRHQRTDLPEALKKQLALCKAGHAHPREFFLHVSQLADHVRDTMERYNHERQDGQILRGNSPLEQWAQDNPKRRDLPDQAKWMYRSAMSIAQVTKNGVRVTQGSGRKLLVYYYDNPQVLPARQGDVVTVYWNDHNPDADAVILAKSPGDNSGHATRKFLCLATRVQPLSRFSATDAQLDAEAERKKTAMHYSRSELRSIQPDLARAQSPSGAPISHRPGTPTGSNHSAQGCASARYPGSAGKDESNPEGVASVSPAIEKIGAELAAADARAQHKDDTARAHARAIARTELTNDDILAALADPKRRDPQPTEDSSDELSSLFSAEPQPATKNHEPDL